MKRFLLAALLVSFSSTFALGEQECSFENHCIQDQDLQVQIAKAKIRGKTATVSLRMKNISDNTVKVRMFGTYIEAVSESGEYRRYKANLTEKFELRAGQLRSLGYTIEFDEEAGKAIDLTLTLEEPAASFSFIEVK